MFVKGKFSVSTIAHENEAQVLKQFSALLTDKFNTTNHALCAHNGKEFDFPFLCRRFIINNMPLPGILRIQGLKPWEVKHIDTLDLWKFGDYKHYTSLNLLAHVFGIPSPKDSMDGSMVAKTFYEEKDLKKIAEYCTKDVITLARVYRRFTGSADLNTEQINFV
jgi:3'-5' exonuclease